MKRLGILIIFSVLLASIGFSSSEQVLKKVVLKIEGMTTPCCAEEVKEALLKVKGVIKVPTCCHIRGIAEIEIEAGKVTNEQLIKVVEEAGFKAKVKEEGEEGELQVLMKKFETEFMKLAQKYNIPQKEIEEHWNLVKKEAAEVFQRCCDWSLDHGMEIEDAHAYCWSAILAGIGKLSLAEQIFTSKGTKMTEKEVIKVAKLVCEVCGAETPVPVVHCGPGILGEDPSKLYCPTPGHTESIEIPKHCKKPMKYVEAKGTKMSDAEIKDLVKDRYGKFAEKYADKGNPCPIRKKQVGELYSKQELPLVFKTARNLALGCGNPVNFANLKPGEVVVDLGCGAGIDVILEAHKVGPSGKVIGVDLTPQMIEKAKQAVAEAGLQDRRIELYVGDIEKLQLPNSLANVAISNCVIILVPNKDAAYQEAFRILKPGGRIAISDIVFAERISPEIKERFQSTWAGVVGGAIAEKDYLEIVKKAGFRQIEVVERHFLTPDELFAMSACPGREFVPSPDPKDLEAVQGKVVSIKFTAIKLEEIL